MPQTVQWPQRNATNKTSGSGSLLVKMLSIPVFPEAGVFNHCLVFLLELPRFLVAAVADPHRVVPAAGGHGASLLRAVVAHALATGATVVDGETGGELPLALAAGVDVLIRDPVGRASCVLHQAERYVNGTNYST